MTTILFFIIINRYYYYIRYPPERGGRTGKEDAQVKIEKGLCEKRKGDRSAAARRLLPAFCVLLFVLLVAPATRISAFAYIHDPAENAAAMKDIVKDDRAVYGFRPSETGSLKAYAAADWSDPETVAKGREDRIAYHASIESMYEMLDSMRAEGKSTEQIARAVSARRNELRLAAYEGDPEGLAAVKQRNLEKYGHEEGPLPDELYAQYGSWETVIEKAFSANAGMDACLGLYDDYYLLYVTLGQVPDAASPGTADTAFFFLIAAPVSALACAVLAGRRGRLR